MPFGLLILGVVIGLILYLERGPHKPDKIKDIDHSTK
jgi:hypothetical protein